MEAGGIKIIGEVNDDGRAKLNYRRELRRRRILENAKNRLEKLNGRFGNGNETAQAEINDEPVQFSDPEVEPDAIPYVRNTTQLIRENGVNEGNVNTFLQYKAHILMAVIIGYLFSGYSIFLPSGICLALDAVYCKQYRHVNPIINAVLALSGLKPKMAQKIFKFYFITQSLFTNIFLIVFLSCSIGYLLQSTNNRLAYLVKFK